MTYAEANAQLQGRCKWSRKIGHNTYLERRTDDIVVRFHNTDVIVFTPDGSTTIRNAGWQTLTTKERINWALPAGFVLYQKASEWFLQQMPWNTGKTWKFADGMRIGPRGAVYGAYNA